MGKSLSDKQKVFVDAVLRGTHPVDAAKLAEYAQPSLEAYRLMRSPNVQKQLHERRTARFAGDLSTLALKTLVELMEDGPAQQRYQASRYVLEVAGHRADAKGVGEGEKDLGDMTPDELAHAVQAGTQALAEIAASLGGQHVVDGERRTLRDVTPALDGESISTTSPDMDDADYADLLD
jgi:phage terminase small subunit